MASKEEKEKKILTEVQRTELIKTIAKETGFKSMSELQSVLAEDYGVEVHVDTLYNDLMRIELFKNEDLQAFNNKILAACSSHLDNLNKMSVAAKYENQRIRAIDSYFRNAVEMVKLMRICSTKKQLDVPSAIVHDEDVIPVIHFGDDGDEETK